MKKKFPKENIEKINKKYHEETGIRLLSSSQINLYPIMYDNVKNEKFLNLFRFFSFDKDITDRRNLLFNSQPYECEYTDWFENISYNFYQNVSLWWVICKGNDIKNPFEEINSGDQLFIMNRKNIYKLLKEMDKTAEL